MFRRFWNKWLFPAAEKPPANDPGEPIDTELLAALEAALLTVPPITREVFLLHRIDDLDYLRIGRQLGITVAEVKDHMVVAIWVLYRASKAHHGE